MAEKSRKVTIGLRPKTGSPLDPPDSPPVGPVIPEGMATKVGKVIIAALVLLAFGTESGLIELDDDTNALIDKIVVAAGLLMGGRYAQAFAKYRSGNA